MPRFANETVRDYTAAFEALLAGLVKAIEFEKVVYEQHGRITYLADRCMLDLFTDNTERSPTFMLPPLRSSRDRHLAQSWAFVKNPLHPTVACWNEMMRRHPRCLEFTSEDARSLGMPQPFIDSPPLIKYSDLITYMIGNEPTPERIKGCARAAERNMAWTRPPTRAEAVEAWIREVKALGIRAVRETTDAGNIDKYFDTLRKGGAKQGADRSGSANGGAQTRQGQSDEPPDEEDAQDGPFADALDAVQRRVRHREGRQDERGVEARLDPHQRHPPVDAHAEHEQLRPSLPVKKQHAAPPTGGNSSPEPPAPSRSPSYGLTR